MSDHFQRSRTADGSAALLADILDLHRARPGITEATLGGFRTFDGRDGYAVLAEAVPRLAGSPAILDLGCGNGPLLEALHRVHPDAILHGLDLCETDLSLAAERCPYATLHLAPAQSVGALARSFGAVVSHHAFYLFDPVEPVIEGIRKVLAPGGSFLFATVHPDVSPLYRALMSAMAAINRRERPAFRGWGDPRVWSPEGLGALFAEGFEAPVVTTVPLFVKERPSALCDRLLRFYYSVELHRPEVQQEIADSWLQTLEAAADPSGRVHLDFPGAIVSCRRR